MGDANAMRIYTDGSSAPTPRTGGVGFRVIFPDGSTVDFSPFGYKGATNNEMELQACVLALREVLKLDTLRGATSITICADSSYVNDNIGNAKFRWPKQKWTRSNGEPVLNVEQWKELIRLIQRVWIKFRVSVEFEKVAAHAGHEHNEAADKLAKRSRKTPYSGISISTTTVRRRRTKNKTVTRSIRGEGQRLRIHVVTASWLPHQRLYRSRCEVLSRKSKYFGNVDFLISDTALSAGHVYDVILADGLEYCRVVKVIKEIKSSQTP